MKAVLLVADGMADRPMKELCLKTPLEASCRPALNEMAKTGISGIIDPIAPGTPPGSDASTLALLGYDSLKVYSGRGALEAAGSGVEVLPGDVAFRCNFATVDDRLVVLDRRAGRIANADASRLTVALQKVNIKKSYGVRFFFKNTVQHRAALVLRGSGLSKAVSDSDPETVGKKILQVKALDNSREAKHTAMVANELSEEFHEILRRDNVNKQRIQHKLPPANMVLFRGAGTIPKISSLHEVFGVKAACIAAVSLIKGICKVAGMRLIDVKGATGTPQTGYMAKVKAAVQALNDNDFVFLHVKAPDVASHDGNVKLKIETIEKIDKMVGYMLDNTDPDSTYLAMTADHTTSSATKNHEGDPVPVVITGPYVRRDGVTEFGERTCAEGGLDRLEGKDLMRILMNLCGKVQKFGA